jgi:hypothetical protein
VIHSDRIEVEWKYLLHLDPADSERPKPSANAKPLPEHLKESDSSLAITNRTDGVPEMGDPFHDPNSTQKWAEFNTAPEATQRVAKVDLDKPERLWYYLGKTSTEARPQYTHDLAKPLHNPKSNFLDTVKPAPIPIPLMHRQTYATGYSLKPAPMPHAPQTPVQQHIRPNEKPYQYKPKVDPGYPSHVYNYSPDSRKNPNSPVAHQPNVVYNHRSPGHQYGQPPYPNMYHQRPSPTFHQYHPPPSSSTAWKPQNTGHLLNGIEQYASSAPSAPPYSYHTPAPSDSTKQLPPFPYGGNSQAHVYSPPAQAASASQQKAEPHRGTPLANILSKPAGPTNSPMYANAPSPYSLTTSHMPSSQSEYLTYVTKYPYLKNAFLRRAKTYISPYSPDGGFSRDWPPKPTSGTPTNHTAAHRPPTTSHNPPPAFGQHYHTGPSPGQPPYRPMPQFQTADDFRREMARAPAAPSAMPKFDSMIRQLASSSGSPSQSSSRTPPSAPSNGGPLPQPSQTSASHGQYPSHAPPAPPPNQTPKPSPITIVDPKELPRHTECNLAGDVIRGSVNGTTPSPLPQVQAGETR